MIHHTPAPYSGRSSNESSHTHLRPRSSVTKAMHVLVSQSRGLHGTPYLFFGASCIEADQATETDAQRLRSRIIYYYMANRVSCREDNSVMQNLGWSWFCVPFLYSSSHIETIRAPSWFWIA
jgi:hypothetical protein